MARRRTSKNITSHRSVISDLESQRKRISVWKVIFLIGGLIAIFALLGKGAENISPDTDETDEQSADITPVASEDEPGPSTAPTPTVIPLTGTVDETPLKNTIYYDTHLGAVFYTSDGLNTFFENDELVEKDTVGLLGLGDYDNRASFDYNELQDPIRIHTFTQYDFADQFSFVDHLVTR